MWHIDSGQNTSNFVVVRSWRVPHVDNVGGKLICFCNASAFCVHDRRNGDL